MVDDWLSEVCVMRMHWWFTQGLNGEGKAVAVVSSWSALLKSIVYVERSMNELSVRVFHQFLGEL